MKLTPNNISIEIVSKILQEQNSEKSKEEINALFLDCLESSMNSWDIHGFLVSGYADGWVYKPNKYRKTKCRI